MHQVAHTFTSVTEAPGRRTSSRSFSAVAGAGGGALTARRPAIRAEKGNIRGPRAFPVLGQRGQFLPRASGRATVAGPGVPFSCRVFTRVRRQQPRSKLR